PAALLPPAVTLFFFNPPPTTPTYTLSLHDALPISLMATAATTATAKATVASLRPGAGNSPEPPAASTSCFQRRFECSRANSRERSEEHTSELQSLRHLVCRLLLEKKKTTKTENPSY